MRLRQLETFRTVARTLNFRRAAERLHYAQSSVTEQVQGLESDLGVPLFDRTGRKLRLTEAGTRLLTYADQMLSLEEAARAAVTGQDAAPSGPLTLRAPETLCARRLPPLLTAFHARHPQVRLTVQPAGRADVRRGLQEAEIDLGLFLGAVPRGLDVACEEISREPLCLVAPPGHALAGRPSVTAVELADRAFISTQTGCAYRDVFESAWAEAGPLPQVVAEVGSVAAVARCVASGMGLAVLPEVAVLDELARGDVVALRWDALPCAGVWMAWNAQRLSPAAVAFLSMAREMRVEGERSSASARLLTAHP
ncbi:LysR family transcriptional regulator [Corallococcus carmarthensis]|uniref:LysR family transcriptional regulator n=1 Tax=Corallococcus carmarthensis TaxID=2316728 RepID=A0A3A8K0T4_9BACT|nr:LysR family transcriptional regulator [Corallococcus carmarthensis]RKG97690.1 LysR family transcriptional regulator [Corallococcus carmarthensis]